MKVIVRSVEFVVATLLLCMSATPALGAAQSANSFSEQPATFDVVRTNWIQRAHTNVIEIEMPRVFVVNEYRTNTMVKITTNTVEVTRTRWVDQFETNVTYALRTNWTTRMQTNTVTLERFNTNVIDFVKTNVVVAYSTNWVTRALTNAMVVDQYRTNRINAYTTNWVTKAQTNKLVVDQVRTNVLYAYYTNWTTLSITNWQTVLVMKTNWVTQPVTNIVAIDLPANSPPLATPSATVTAQNKDVRTDNAALSAEDIKNLVFEWARVDSNKPEILLTLKSATDPGTLLQIQEWRVEKSDATVLLMGRQREFRGELPPGIYNVTAKIRRNENGPVMTLRGSINVTLDTETHQVLVAAAGQRK